MISLRTLSCLCSIALIVCISSLALAQSNDFPELSSSSSTSTIVMGVTSAPIWTTAVSEQSERKSVEMYLRHHGPSVAYAMHLGAGRAVSDLTQLLGLPSSEAQALAGRLRKHRKALLALANIKRLNPKRVRAFIALIKPRTELASAQDSSALTL